MNTQNILLLADFIQQHVELPFDMLKPNKPDTCGTAGCIGGFGASIWPQIITTRDMWSDEKGTMTPQQIFEARDLAEILEIDDEDADHLFFPSDNDVRFSDTNKTFYYEEITRNGAIKTLRRLVASGEVVWIKGEQTT